MRLVNCKICNTQFDAESDGIILFKMKGEIIIEDCFCSKECRNESEQ